MLHEVSFLACLGGLLRLLLAGQFGLIEIAERLGGRSQRQCAIRVVTQIDVVQGHDARQLCQVSRESADVVIAADQVQCDRYLGIELPRRLTLDVYGEGSVRAPLTFTRGLMWVEVDIQ